MGLPQYYCGDIVLFTVELKRNNMTGKELLQYLQGLSEEDLAKDILLEEDDYDNMYEIDSVYTVEDEDIVLSVLQVYE